MDTITLEKRGCDFFNGDHDVELSDVGNYRVGIYDYSIHCINGRDYILEFGSYNLYNYRTTNKRTGAALKHPVRELVNSNALSLNTEFQQVENGWTMDYRDSQLEKVIYRMGFSYTKADILKVINMISETKYDNIEIK